jgi:hypothetical protein
MWHLCVALVCLAAADETPATTPAIVASMDPRAVEVQFVDGSSLKLLLADERIEIATPHGKLQVPTDEVRRIEFALRLPEEVAQRIGELIELLRNPDAETHQPAANELLALREKAYLPLAKAAKGGDPQLAPRATELVKKLRARLSRQELALRDDDLIETTEAKIAGRIDMPALKVHTSQFGELALKLADARSLRHQSLIARPVQKDPENVLPDPGHLKAYEPRLQETFAFRVTGAIVGSVWGTDVYTTDSNLATAAVHAGVVKVGETGIVRVKILPSPVSFAGSVRNGVATSNYGRYGGAYQILKGEEKEE